MPKLNLTQTQRMKIPLGEVLRLKTSQFYWDAPNTVYNPTNQPRSGLVEEPEG